MSNLEDKDPRTNGRWTKGEHQKFLLGLELYGKNWKKIQELVATRTGSQIRSHAQKFFLKVKNTGDGQQNDREIQSSNDCAQPLTVISKAASEHFEITSDNSFFIEKIIKASSPNHLSFDFWNNFIDIKSSKKEQEELKNTQKKDSFVSFENMSETKNDSPLSNPNLLTDGLA